MNEPVAEIVPNTQPTNIQRPVSCGRSSTQRVASSSSPKAQRRFATGSHQTPRWKVISAESRHEDAGTRERDAEYREREHVRARLVEAEPHQYGAEAVPMVKMANKHP